MTYAQSAQLFWDTGQPGRTLFALVGPEKAGPDLFRPIVGRGSAYADIDVDIDAVLTVNGSPARLFRDDGGNKNHWIRLAPRGHPSNRDVIAAKVMLKAGDRTDTRQLYQCQGLPFGHRSAADVRPRPRRAGRRGHDRLAFETQVGVQRLEGRPALLGR